MRLFLALLLVFGLAATAFAGVDGEIVSQDIDDRGNIRVWTVYSVDGVEVESRYPKMDGHFVYCTRYSKRNFDGMTNTEILERIDADLKQHGKTLTQHAFNAVAAKSINQIQIDYKVQVNTAFATDKLKTLVGRKVSVTSAVIKMDTDGNGLMDKELTIRTDGTKTEKNI